MPKSEDKELIKNVRASKDGTDRLLLSSVCQRLIESGFNVAGTLVSYYSPIEEMYIFVGKDPIPKEKDGISMNNLSKNRLVLKFRAGDNGSPKNTNFSVQEQAAPFQTQGLVFLYCFYIY